jgi:hypothetical protein
MKIYSYPIYQHGAGFGFDVFTAWGFLYAELALWRRCYRLQIGKADHAE